MEVKKVKTCAKTCHNNTHSKFTATASNCDRLNKHLIRETADFNNRWKIDKLSSAPSVDVESTVPFKMLEIAHNSYDFKAYVLITKTDSKNDTEFNAREETDTNCPAEEETFSKFSKWITRRPASTSFCTENNTKTDLNIKGYNAKIKELADNFANDMKSPDKHVEDEEDILKELSKLNNRRAAANKKDQMVLYDFKDKRCFTLQEHLCNDKLFNNDKHERGSSNSSEDEAAVTDQEDKREFVEYLMNHLENLMKKVKKRQKKPKNGQNKPKAKQNPIIIAQKKGTDNAKNDITECQDENTHKKSEGIIDQADPTATESEFSHRPPHTRCNMSGLIPKESDSQEVAFSEIPNPTDFDLGDSNIIRNILNNQDLGDMPNPDLVPNEMYTLENMLVSDFLSAEGGQNQIEFQEDQLQETIFSAFMWIFGTSAFGYAIFFVIEFLYSYLYPLPT